MVEQVVGEVKAKKMETMKAIKRMQVQKEQLGKKQKHARVEYDKVRLGLNTRREGHGDGRQMTHESITASF